MTQIKVCGISDLEAGLAALEVGADYLGFVFYPPSHRFLDLPRAAALIGQLRSARPHGWRAVGVFVNEPSKRVLEAVRTCRLDVAQFNGEETAGYLAQVSVPVFRAVRLGGAASAAAIPHREDFGAERILLDTSVPGHYGGTGVAYAWGDFRASVEDAFLAGGLTPDNVAEAIAAAHPWGVDVSSGVEENKLKRPELIRGFIAAVHAADSAAQVTPSPLPSARADVNKIPSPLAGEG